MNRVCCLFLSETMTERKTDSFDGLHDPGSDVLCLEIVLLSGEKEAKKDQMSECKNLCIFIPFLPPFWGQSHKKAGQPLDS